MKAQNESATLDRIRKLLNLAGEGNPSATEAASALAMAQQLMHTHQIDLLDVKERPAPDEFETHYVGDPYDRAPSQQKFICPLLRNHFHVRVLLGHIYTKEPVPTAIQIKIIDGKKMMCSRSIPELAGRGHGDRAVMLIGKRSAVLVGEYVYDFLFREFERLWKVHQRETGKGAYAKLDFYEGLYRGLDERLRNEQRRQECKVTPAQRQQFAVIQVNEDEALFDYFRQEYPSVNRRRSNHRERRDVDSYADGQAAGQNLNIRPAVNQGRGIKALKEKN
jgi:Protein of unknown function (DUF2786)